MLKDLGPCVNKKINDKFLRALESSSSDCSSSSTDSSSDDDDDRAIRIIGQIKQTITQLKNKTKKIQINKLTNDAEIEDEEDEDGIKTGGGQKYLKTKGEKTLDDLDPISLLKISLDDSVKLVKTGQVISIVDGKLVVIQSSVDQNGKMIPLDEDTILFDTNRNSFGKIFETFGPVTNPFYSIRFNNLNEIQQFKLEVGAIVFYAPDSKELTRFVFNLDELRKMKGSDASWNNDNEPPDECLEYSDDEKEREAKKKLKNQRRKLNTDKSIDSDESETEETAEDNECTKPKQGLKRAFNNNNHQQRFDNRQHFNKNNNTNQMNQRPPQLMNQQPQFYGQPQQQPGFMMAPPHPSQFMPPPYNWQPYNQQFYNNPYNNNNNMNNQPAPMFYPNQFQPNFYPNQVYQQAPQQFVNNSNNRQFIPQQNPTQQQQQQTPATQIVDKRFIKNSNYIKKSF